MKNMQTIDIFDDAVDYLTEEEQEELLERVREEAKDIKVPTVPCQCHWCDNFIDETELFYIVGIDNEHIICLECAEPIFVREDAPPPRYDDYYDF
jgi:hypothetical protein